MEFEWDDAKSDKNFLERGFDFAFAARIFEGPVIYAIDDRRDYGEVRVRAIGCVEDFIITVVYTDRPSSRRIISAWPAHDKERAQWQKFISQIKKYL